MAKSFDAANTGRKRTSGEAVSGMVRTSNSTTGGQAEADPVEQAERKSSQRTQGRKNCYMDRISVSFTPENMDFLKTMSAMNGETVSKYLNRILEEYRDVNSELYDQAVALRNKEKIPKD